MRMGGMFSSGAAAPKPPLFWHSSRSAPDLYKRWLLRRECMLARTQNLCKLLLGRIHCAINVAAKDSLLKHCCPWSVVVVDQLILMHTIDGFPDAHLVCHEDVARIELAVLVVCQI